MKRLLFAFLALAVAAGCSKPGVTTAPQTAQPTTATSGASKDSAGSKQQDKAKIEELEGLKKLSPEEISSDMIAKAQSSLSDASEETGVLAKKILFEFDSYELTADARTTLQEAADYLKGYKTLRINIEGHCDERGTREYNLALGMKRAEAAKKYLADLGVDDSRLQIISYGEDKPAVTGHDEDAWSQNRRDQFKRIQ